MRGTRRLPANQPLPVQPDRYLGSFPQRVRQPGLVWAPLAESIRLTRGYSRAIRARRFSHRRISMHTARVEVSVANATRAALTDSSAALAWTIELDALPPPPAAGRSR